MSAACSKLGNRTACGLSGARVTARLPFEGVPLEAGEVREAEPLRVTHGESATPLLEAWADAFGRRGRARVPERSTVGWCSWYYYFTSITEERIRGNLDRLGELNRDLPLELFQIDDGYQEAIGSWLTTNAKFPRGMKPLADAIAERGYAPGLWLAPFIARSESTILREHPDWFVRNTRGKPRYALYNPFWGKLGTAKALDTTHPEVQRWLGEVFRTITAEWGFRFVKIDFLYAAALPGRRYDPRATGAEALRRGLEVVRQAVGDDVHILGCGSPIGPAVGLVDSMRVGIDVAPYWSDFVSRRVGRDYDMASTKNALRNVLTRAFMHRRLWQNDPDCLLVRAERTKLSLDEVRSLATIAALSGGTMLVSDDLTELAADRLALARQAIDVNREVSRALPRCPDLMESSFPGLLWADRDAGGGYLAVFNPSDAPTERRVVLDALPELPAWVAAAERVEDVWLGADLPVRAGVLELGPLAAHAVRLLRFDGPER